MFRPRALCLLAMSSPKLPATLMLAMALLGTAGAQSTDDIHVRPRQDSSELSATLTPDPNLHTRPLRADVDLVLVPVTVTDAMNRPVLSLSQSDFVLYDDAAPQKIRYFSYEDGPISVALVLDCSASMKKKVEYEGQALSEFLNNANPEDEYFAVTVSDKPHLIARSSDSIGTIQDRLAASPPHGHTALFDAIYMAISQLRNARYHRRALLIISDGGDNRSRYTRKETKNAIEEADVLTYAIGIFDEEPVPLLKSLEERMGRDWLSELTDASGGRTIAADDRRKIPEIAALISRELRSQYLLGYRPTNAARDGKWRKINVKVASSAGSRRLQVHFRERYRAPSE